MDKRALQAAARLDGFAALAPSEGAFKAVEAQSFLRLLGAVALDAGPVENRLYVRRVSYTISVSSRWQLADIRRQAFLSRFRAVRGENGDCKSRPEAEQE